MNRLKKTDGRRGKGPPTTHPPSVRAAGTYGPVTGDAGARAQAGATCVRQDAGVHRVGASPIGGGWPMSSPSEGLYPPGGFSNLLESNPFANHRNGNENFHLVGAGVSQSSLSSIDLDATRTPSPAQQTDDTVGDLNEEEDETISIDEDCRTDKRFPWTVDDDI